MSYDPKKIYAVLHKNKVFVLRKVHDYRHHRMVKEYYFHTICSGTTDPTNALIEQQTYSDGELAIQAAVEAKHFVNVFYTYEEFAAWLGKQYAYTEPDTAPKTKPGYPNTPSIIYATIEKSTNIVMVLRHIPGGEHGTEQYGFRSISPLHAYSLVGDKATIKEAISAAEKCGHVIEMFTTDEAFMGWLGKLYAAPVLPFNGVVPRPTDTERIELLEKRVTQMRDWWGKKMDEFAETLRETLINKTKPEEDVPTRWEPSHRENGFYVVTTPTIPIPFVAHSVNGKWYIPGEKLHYAGYLRVHRKLDMYG